MKQQASEGERSAQAQRRGVQWKTKVRNSAIVLMSVVFIVFLFRLSEAGSLTPDAVPAGTMNTVEEIYDSLVSETFDSSAVTASANGSALEISRCIIDRLGGGSCP